MTQLPQTFINAVAPIVLLFRALHLRCCWLISLSLHCAWPLLLLVTFRLECNTYLLDRCCAPLLLPCSMLSPLPPALTLLPATCPAPVNHNRKR